MPIKYNVDAVLNEDQPIIVFRGKEYKVRDLTVKETIQNIRDAHNEEEKIDRARKQRITEEVIADGFEEDTVEDEVERRLVEMSPEEAFLDYVPLAIETLTRALEGFSKDIGDSLTLKEFQALKSALNAANGQVYKVEGEKDTEKKSPRR
jgi:hypothetical protein